MSLVVIEELSENSEYKKGIGGDIEVIYRQ